MKEWYNLKPSCFKKEKFKIYSHATRPDYVKLKVARIEWWNSCVHYENDIAVKRTYTTIIHLENGQSITIGDENMRNLLWHGYPIDSGHHDGYTITYDNTWNNLASRKRLKLLKAFRQIAGEAVAEGEDSVDVLVLKEGKDEPLLNYTINNKRKGLVKTHILRGYQITHFLTYLNDMYNNTIGNVRFNITRRK